MSTILLCALLWAAPTDAAVAEEPKPAEAPAADNDEPAGTDDPAGETNDAPATDAGPAGESPDDTPDNAEPTAETPELAPTRVVVPDLEAQGVDADLAANLTNVILTRLSQLPNLEIVARQDLANLLDQEKQRQLVGCGDDAACLSDLAGALDAGLLVTGTVGKVGERYLLSLALLDTTNAKLIRRVSREALLVDSLVTAANEATVALWATGAIQVERCIDCDDTGLSKKWEAAIKIGNNFSTFFKSDLDVSSIALSLDIDVGYRVWTSVAVFGSIGMRLNSVKRTDNGNEVAVQVLPIQAGIRYHTPRFFHGLSAYFAGAIGLGFLRTAATGQEADLLAAFSARAYSGLVYAVDERVGVLFELSYELTAKHSADLQASRLNAAGLRLGLSYGF